MLFVPSKCLSAKFLQHFRCPCHVIHDKIISRYLTVQSAAFFGFVAVKDGNLHGHISSHLLFFNVSSISKNETIIRARIHLHRRRTIAHQQDSSSRVPQFLPTPCHIFFYQTRSQHSKRRKLVALPVTPISSGGWLQLDVTAPLQEIHTRPLLLAVGFENSKGSPVPINEFLKPLKSKKRKHWAFISVVSASDDEEGLEEFRERHLKHKEHKADGNEMGNEIVINAGDISKRKMARSKEAELQIRQRNLIHSLPFLHVGEIADLRRSTGRTRRSLLEEKLFTNVSVPYS